MFCQSAIDSAQNDHAAIVQSILENKDLNGVHGFLHMCDMKKTHLQIYANFLRETFKQFDDMCWYVVKVSFDSGSHFVHVALAAGSAPYQNQDSFFQIWRTSKWSRHRLHHVPHVRRKNQHSGSSGLLRIFTFGCLVQTGFADFCACASIETWVGS